MERKTIGQHTTKIFAALFFLAWSFFPVAACFAADEEPAGTVQQIETTVVHVDEYAVYAPNLIFYFDTRMEKRKIASLMNTANRLRNRKALITLSSAGDSSQDKHVLLLDIAPADGKPHSEKPPREAPEQAADTQPKPKPDLSTEDEAPVDSESGEPQRPLKQTVFQDKKPPGTAEAVAPITRDEVTDFVRELLELNGRKDLSAIGPFYADKVDYYDRGLVSRDDVRKDLGYYFRNWDNISTSLDGDVLMAGTEQHDVKIVKFISSFAVNNQKKALAGKTENVWTIQRINHQLKIIDVKQRIISRESSGDSPVR